MFRQTQIIWDNMSPVQIGISVICFFESFFVFLLRLFSPFRSRIMKAVLTIKNERFDCFLGLNSAGSSCYTAERTSSNPSEERNFERWWEGWQRLVGKDIFISFKRLNSYVVACYYPGIMAVNLIKIQTSLREGLFLITWRPLVILVL